MGRHPDADAWPDAPWARQMRDGTSACTERKQPRAPPRTNARTGPTDEDEDEDDDVPEAYPDALAAVAVLAAMHGAQAFNEASSESFVVASGVGPFTFTDSESYVYAIDAEGVALAEAYGVGIDSSGLAVAESIAFSLGDFGFADTFTLAETLGLGTGFSLAYADAYTFAEPELEEVRHFYRNASQEEEEEGKRRNFAVASSSSSLSCD
eukprot:CAMPEP_0198246934 /NCGR_PEP_ID=MMETSP1446-20131203/46212_1 /TAXON_ID=1461542 ORGANISM="Unidentified sp, Strain CCMP2111" /NCGR_SAMPLE_ID=MMETSP1446 /ASSEMBLY_ACC=CAM_ASM_001112 /LENGTH=208 /DNA_ID=CAMNT_0043931259 /DNA_START=785 /DNA_END=1414 /DNA_ORIENTATION=+